MWKKFKLKIVVLALILLSTFANASMLQEATLSKNNGIVILTHGMGAEVEKFKWYAESDYINIIKAIATQKNLDYLFVPWLEVANEGGMFAGLDPMDRLKGSVKLAMEILKAAQHHDSITLVGYSFGGQVLAGALNLIASDNGDLGSVLSLKQELASLVITIAELGTNFFPPLSRARIVLKAYWNLIEKIAASVDQNLTKTAQFEYVLNFIEKELTLSYLKEVEAKWCDAYAYIQLQKQLLGIKQINIDKLITIGTPVGEMPIFNPDPKLVQQHIHFYSTGDYVAMLVGKRSTALGGNIADISVYFETETPGCCGFNKAEPIASTPRPIQSYSDKEKYAPGHTDLIGGNIQMAPWLLSIPECFTTDKSIPFFGQEMTMTFHKDLNKLPDISYTNQPQQSYACCCNYSC